MQKQFLKLNYNGIWRIIRDDTKNPFPFILYRETYDGMWHRNKYLQSDSIEECLLLIAEIIGDRPMALYRKEYWNVKNT